MHKNTINMRLKILLKKIMPKFLWNLTKKAINFFAQFIHKILTRRKTLKIRKLHKTRLKQNVIRKNNSIPEKDLRITKKIFIDCGTHEGEGLQHFINLYDIDESWTVYTFEPNKMHHKTIENKFKQKNINIIHKAIWIFDGFINFYTSWDNSGSSILKRSAELAGATLRKRLLGKKKGEITEKGKEFEKYKDKNPLPLDKVACIDFSNFLKNNFNKNDYIIIKFDIEGAEYEVLKKMEKDKSFLYIDEIYIEFHDRFIKNESEDTNKRLIKQIEKAGIKFNEWY